MPVGPIDTRVAYGIQCTWWGDIYSVGVRFGTSLPCCPFCAGLLLEYATEAEFMADAEKYEAEGHPGYVDKIKWSKGKRCLRSWDDLERVYFTEKARGN